MYLEEFVSNYFGVNHGPWLTTGTERDRERDNSDLLWNDMSTDLTLLLSSVQCRRQKEQDNAYEPLNPAFLSVVLVSRHCKQDSALFTYCRYSYFSALSTFYTITKPV